MDRTQEFICALTAPHKNQRHPAVIESNLTTYSDALVQDHMYVFLLFVCVLLTVYFLFCLILCVLLSETDYQCFTASDASDRVHV